MRPRNPRGEGVRLRAELVAAATRLLERDGRDAVLTLRSVAREAGVAAPSVYAHFADLDALVLAVIADHLEDLAGAVSGAVAGAAPGRARVQAVAAAYVEWGLAHPGPYTVVFEGRALRRLTVEQEVAMTEDSGLLDAVAGVLADALEGRPRTEAYDAALGLWTALHGVVALRLAKPAFPWPDLDAQVERAVDAALPPG